MTLTKTNFAIDEDKNLEKPWNEDVRSIESIESRMERDLFLKVPSMEPLRFIKIEKPYPIVFSEQQLERLNKNAILIHKKFEEMEKPWELRKTDEEIRQEDEKTNGVCITIDRTLSKEEINKKLKDFAELTSTKPIVNFFQGFEDEIHKSLNCFKIPIKYFSNYSIKVNEKELPIILQNPGV